MIKTAMDIKQKVIDIIAHELKIPSEKINYETSMHNTAEWDSLAFISIISKLEEKLDIEIDLEDAEKMVSINSILAILESTYGC